jgi:hypothetical protein
MGASRNAGPICGSTRSPGWIDDGTLVRTRSPTPGPVCGSSQILERRLEIPADVPSRLLLAARAGLPNFGDDVRDKIAEALTLQNMAFIAAAIVVDIAASGTGVGVAINILIGGAAVVFLGLDAVRGCRHLSSFYRMAVDAKSEDDFRMAGAEFSKGVITLGVDSALILLTRRAGTKISGKVAPVVSDAELRAGWFGYIDSMVFDVPQNQGILWAKIGDVRAAKIAQEKGPGFRVINMLLQKNGFLARYAAEFANRQSELTYQIWERVSMKYVSSLKGQVTVYVDQGTFRSSIVTSKEGMLSAGRGGGAWSPPIPVLVTELEEATESNPAITSIKMIDEKTGTTVGTYFRSAPGSTH